MGNESALFADFYTPWDDPSIYTKQNSGRTTNDVDPGVESFHPLRMRDDFIRGHYTHLGPIAGLRVQVTQFVILKGYAGYLPVVDASTIKDRFNGSYNYADLCRALFFDLGLSIDLIGE